MSAVEVDVELTTLAGSAAGPLTPRSGTAHAWFRRSLLAVLLALAVGGCTMVQAGPVDRAGIGMQSPIAATAARSAPTQAADDAAWRLRLTRL
ncbi:hypothetical protein MKK88_15920 [Methylobacterium sp. E-005]|uniref:hypothetical protein n=1 Tax=Methylobacterium sp. E-005 TaxID=2836549 RepID=UPI001FBA2D42|nr:hypothetical protein [Methylobacterium sp. E-005]MCJ2087458.1 hypothetical protein [Methylobacterium sp. E-005]